MFVVAWEPVSPYSASARSVPSGVDAYFSPGNRGARVLEALQRGSHTSFTPT